MFTGAPRGDMWLGVQGISGDPTQLSAALLSALGFVTTRDGPLLGPPGAPSPGRYIRYGTDEPLLVATLVDGEWFTAFQATPAITPLVPHSADLTNDAWTEDDCTAELALGGLEHGPEWRGENYFDEYVPSEWNDVGDASDLAPSGFTTTGVGGQSKDQELPTDKFLLLAIDVTVSGGADFSIYDTGSSSTSNRLLGSGNGAGEGVGTGVYQIVFRPKSGGLYFRRATSGTVVFNSFSIDEVDAHSVLTATDDNATAYQAINRASAARQARVQIEAPDTNSGSIFVAHGKPGDTPAYADDFDSDTSGEWTRGSNSVDGTIAVSGGKLVHTAGAGDGSFPRFVRAISGFTVGELVRIVGPKGGTGSSVVLFGSDPVSAGSIANLPGVFEITAPTMYLGLQLNTPTAGQTATLDSISVSPVEETEIEPGEYADVALDEYTGVNPLYSVRIPTDGDEAKVYNIQGFELDAGIAPPRTVPQGETPEAVGGARCIRDIDVAPTAVDYEILVEFVGDNDNPVVAFDNSASPTENRVRQYFSSTQTPRLQVRTAVDGIENVSAGDSQTDGDIFLGRGEVADGLRRFTYDNTSDTGNDTSMPEGINRLTLGSGYNGGVHSGHKIIAFVDRDGGALQQIESYGPELLANGDFADGKTGWTDQSAGTGSFTVADGVATIEGTDASNRGRYRQAFAVEVGEVYEFRSSSPETGIGTIGVSSSSDDNTTDVLALNPQSDGEVTGRFRAGATPLYAMAKTRTSGSTVAVSSMSIRKVNYRQNVGFNLKAIERHRGTL